MRNKIPSLVVVVAVLALEGWISPREAAAYCRTTTCSSLSASFSPTAESCYPPGFAEACAAQNVKLLPVWWRSRCVSYDLHADAQGQVSQQVGLTYAVAAQIAADSFAKWTDTECAVGANLGRVSLDVRDLGPVSCDEVNYNTDQGNQHVILFDDRGIDGNGPADPTNANTLGLTTVTFDPDTGELYDADMEINSSQSLATGDDVSQLGYDLQSIITHEAGHFLGLAHSADAAATMYAQYTPGSTSKRILSDDDMAGICAIYAPDGTRSVDPSVAASGFLAESACDSTPRHGFQSACTSPQNHGCDVAGEDSASLAGPFGIALAGAAAALSRRRRPRRLRSERRI